MMCEKNNVLHKFMQKNQITGVMRPTQQQVVLLVEWLTQSSDWESVLYCPMVLKGGNYTIKCSNISFNP